MKRENISEAVGNISTRHIQEAAVYHKAVRDAEVKKQPKRYGAKRFEWMKGASLAACFCLAVAAFAGYKIYTSTRVSSEYTDTGDNFKDGDPNGNASGPGGLASGDTEIPEQTETDPSPVYYSSLMLPDGELNEEALALSNQSAADILAFDEAMLSQADSLMIIEGTVVNLYVRHYDFDVYDDKFDENDVMHLWTDTVVYEIAVDKTWFGEDVSGETIIVEDTEYYDQITLAVKEGGRYVLPLCKYGENIWTLGHEYAGGNITRESLYCTVYPYHPQIEVTDDGSYLVSEDWTTLIAGNARKVIMDTLDEGDFWKDRMYLVDENTFAGQMAVLCGGIE